MATHFNKSTNSYNGNRAKKSKSELVRSSTSFLLNQKNYLEIDKFRKSDFLLTYNKRQCLFQNMLEGDIFDGNSFTFSNVLCITNNQQIVELHFGRFCDFVKQTPADVRNELNRFYGPLICHLYIELIKAKETKAAISFLDKFASLVDPNKNSLIDTKLSDELVFFKGLIRKLSNYHSIEAAERDPDVCYLRSTKYEINISQTVFNELTAFLQEYGHVLILNILHTWIRISISDNENPSWSEDNFFLYPCKDENEPTEKFVTDLTKSTGMHSTDELKSKRKNLDENIEIENLDAKNDLAQNCRLQIVNYMQSKKEVGQLKIDSPQFVQLPKSVTSANLDTEKCHLVGGLNNSSVLIWQLDGQIYGKNVRRKHEELLCQWSFNYQGIERLHLNNGKIEQKPEFCSNEYNSCVRILRGHSLGVTDVRFSSHIPLLYSTSKDSTIRSWSSETFSCVSIYHGHRYPVWCISESPVGTFFATGSKDLTARLWSVERRNPLITFASHTQDVECIAFHPNGKYIATGSSDLTVRLWCVTSGKLMRIFSDSKQAVISLAFSPDGKMLAVGGEESKIRIFDLAAGSQLYELKDHSATVTSIAWHKNRSGLISACHDGSLRIWDVKSSQTNDNNSTSFYSNRFTIANNHCHRLVYVGFLKGGTICCIGS